ncbi:MAG: diguanylate cyclase [Anaerocolumna sp.]|nr:diguanylate cyclase [Anaerocolumna sp.]
MIKEGEFIKRKYILVLTIISSVLFLAMIYFFLFSINKVSGVYRSKTQETIVDMNKDFMKDTVNNLISDIEIERKT